MSNASARTPSPALSMSSRSSTPEVPVQPDHFYGAQHLPPSPDSDGRTWLDPEDDPLAQRGIPVFKPTMEEFRDFEGYLNKVECWGMKSGIVKVIPPKEWTDALPPLTEPLAQVKLKNPIEQYMLGRGGLFRQENIEKRRIMSVREWAELCAKEEMRAPGIDDIGLHARSTNGSAKPRTRRARRKRESETAEPEHAIKAEEEEEEISPYLAHPHDQGRESLASPPNSVAAVDTPAADGENVGAPTPAPQATGVDENVRIGFSDNGDPHHEPGEDARHDEEEEEKPRSKGKRATQTREAREANLAERAAKDKAFLETFDPHSDWLPPNTTPFDYTVDFCRELERRYWRNCGLGKPAWYGADMQGSLFTDETKEWNVAHLESALSRLLPASSKGLPGVNTPYLYFGMWRATFAWHVEDMDLFSINYVHFGAPKYWYAVPQARATALEQTMRGYFPKDVSHCSQFLRHKSFFASPKLLSSSSCRPNTLVQCAGEFVITFPMGYHAGFNLGFNCAESVNFALESWLDLGRKAKACDCVNFSVRIDVDRLLLEREEEERAKLEADKPRRPKTKPKPGKNSESKSQGKRKTEAPESPSKLKKPKTARPSKGKQSNSSAEGSQASQSKVAPAKVTLKLPPKPKEPEAFPCCLCVSMDKEKLLRVHDPPLWRTDDEVAQESAGTETIWMAHEVCANVIPETWVDEVEVGEVGQDGTRAKERVVFGVDGIVKDRWNLRCSACTRTRYRAHGAPIQCTKGKCPKAFHVSCAREGASHNIVYKELREVEKEVVLLIPQVGAAATKPNQVAPTGGEQAALVPMEGNIDVQSDATSVSLEPSAPTVLKLIRKLEVQVLCSQHNPAVAEAKKLLKQDKIRKELLALPPMSRIKLRVSAGVFEVSLLRVIEETGSVEVLWDRGFRKEFKWGSVVFGNTDGLTIGQKPAEPAAEPEQYVPRPIQPRPVWPSYSAAPPVMDYRYQMHASTSTPPVAGSGMSSPAPSTSASQAYPPPPSYPSYGPNYQYKPTTWRYQQYPVSNSGSQYGAAGPSTAVSYPYSPSAYQPSTYQPYSGYNFQMQPQTQPAQQHSPAQLAQQAEQLQPSQSIPQLQQPEPQSEPEPQPQVQQLKPSQLRSLQWQRPYMGPKAILPAPSVARPPISQTVPYHLHGQSQQSWQTGYATPTAANAAPSPAPAEPDPSPMQQAAPANATS
ncbi:uncharacterized protein LAESUDRAFT_815724 [Laetiporus sulphureus 93-53]|uniref:[histone H3]-trimethyl-L-lysine(9) demethylase n=1 Tax=Laetiporus sulphureus 93-53 TaxID=1314785 RepID=A0A165BTX8_9APHY|nr:uncharacterized protein LAESUDRAFT_815724 [Laetiporus sulphureus 93-53]KZT01645.1 hypothetical protein LAESUDRAFT_815724 [Laetiporus sulphureus 93-53]